jgi:hypothetical protein
MSTSGVRARSRTTRAARPQDAAPDQVGQHEPHLARLARTAQVRLGERQLGRGAAQVRPRTYGVGRVEHRRLDRPAEQRLRVVHEVGVQRVVAGDEDRQRPCPARPARPACCQTEATVPGQPVSTTASSPETSSPSSSALVAATPDQVARLQPPLQLARSSGR